MHKASHSRNLNQKERTRREIERQVEDFLNQGGRIAVVDSQRQQTAAVLGSAWRNDNEVIELIN